MGAWHRRAGVVVTVLAGLAGTAATALGATIVVNAGSSVQTAIDGASAGDTIQIRGVHREAITVTKTLFFTVGAAGGTMDGSSLGTTIATFSGGVTGCTFTGVTFRFGESYGVYMPDNDSTSFTACTFKGMANAAIRVDFSDSVTIAFCNFRGNFVDIEGGPDTNLTLTSNKHRKSTENAVNVWDSDMTMAGCTFDMARDTAIQLEGNDTYSSVGTSRVYRSEGGLNSSDVDGLGIGDLDGQWIRGDFFYDNPGTGACVGYNYYYNPNYPYYGYYQGNCNNYQQNGGAAVADCAVTHVGYNAFEMNGDYASVDNCKLTTGGGWAFHINSDYGLVEDSTAANALKGVYLNGSSTTVQRCTLTGVLREGIRCHNSYSPDIADNVLSGVAGYGGAGAIWLLKSGNASVTGNTVGDVDGGIGILIDGCDGAYVGDNLVKNTAAEGILARSLTTSFCNYNWPYGGYFCNYYPQYIVSYTSGTDVQVSYNTVSSCGNSLAPAISLVRQDYGYAGNNIVASSGGVGIQLDYCDYTTVYRNNITFAERDGIWVRLTWDYYGSANTVDSNTVKWSGAEGIQISACHNFTAGEVVSNNLVTASTLQNLANEGYMDTTNSTGNINGVGVSIDPASWYAIVPVERRLYGGATFCGGGE